MRGEGREGYKESSKKSDAIRFNEIGTDNFSSVGVHTSLCYK